MVYFFHIECEFFANFGFFGCQFTQKHTNKYEVHIEVGATIILRFNLQAYWLDVCMRIVIIRCRGIYNITLMEANLYNGKICHCNGVCSNYIEQMDKSGISSR